MSATARISARINNIEKRLRMGKLNPHNPEFELDAETKNELMEELEKLISDLEDADSF